MWKGIKRQLRVQRDTFFTLVWILLGCWLFGIAAHAFVQRFGHMEEVWPFGTTFALIGAVLMLAILTFGQVLLYFNVELSMGLTRREFFVTHLTVCLLEALEVFFLTAALCAAEGALNRALYAGRNAGAELLPYLLRLEIPLGVLLVILASLIGALAMRFGKPVVMIAWFAWMLLCIGGPRLHDAASESPNSVMGRIGNALVGLIGGVPGYLQWILLAAVCAAGIAGTWTILRKQQVIF